MASISHFTDSKLREDDSSSSNSYLSKNLHDMHIVSTSNLWLCFPTWDDSTRSWYCFGPFLVRYMPAVLHVLFISFFYFLFFCCLTTALIEPN